MNEANVFTVVADVISVTCGIDRDTLVPEQRIQDLGIDSLFAGEILARTERSLQIDIDFRQISDDWSDLTLGDLARQLWARSGAAARLET
jgi:acyl carrier protein